MSVPSDRRSDASRAPVSDAWPAARALDLAALRHDGPGWEEARSRLYELLLRAARFELTRRQATLSHLRDDGLEVLAARAAADSLVVTLARLDDFRGASRFTTWASKFALREAREAAGRASADGAPQRDGHLDG